MKRETPLGLSEDSLQYVGRLVMVWPYSGWGEPTVDRMNSGRFPREVSPPTPFNARVVQLLDHQGELRGAVAVIEEPGHPYDGWQVTFNTRYPGEYDFHSRIGVYNVSIGRVVAPDTPWLATGPGAIAGSGQVSLPVTPTAGAGARHAQGARAAFATVPWSSRDVWFGVLASVVVVGIAFGLLFVLAALLPEPSLDLWAALVPTLFELLFLVPVWWFSVRKYHAPLTTLGFVRFRPSLLAVGVGLLIATYIFNGVYSYLLSTFGLQMQTDLTPVFEQLSSPWPLVVAVVIVAPVVEEVFFRGFVFAGLRTRYDWRWAAVISSALFAAAHMQLTFFIPAFILGGLFAYLYQKSGSVWPSMIIHALVNALAMAAVYVQL
jgi:CAAX protease family protein